MLKNLELNKEIKEWPGIEPKPLRLKKIFNQIHQEDKMLNRVFWLQFERKKIPGN